MNLQDRISQLIKQEIDTDPMGVGYAECKTDEELQAKLNSGITRTVTNYVTDPPPISRILDGVGFAPNIVEVSDVTRAKVIVAEPIMEII